MLQQPMLYQQPPMMGGQTFGGFQTYQTQPTTFSSMQAPTIQAPMTFAFGSQFGQPGSFGAPAATISAWPPQQQYNYSTNYSFVQPVSPEAGGVSLSDYGAGAQSDGASPDLPYTASMVAYPTSIADVPQGARGTNPYTDSATASAGGGNLYYPGGAPGKPATGDEKKKAPKKKKKQPSRSCGCS